LSEAELSEGGIGYFHSAAAAAFAIIFGFSSVKHLFE
jgi:hypothetical protein